MKAKRKARRRPNPKYIAWDDRGKEILKTAKKQTARIIARAASGHVTRKGKVVYSAQRAVKNPMPVNRWVTVKARRTSGGRIQLRGTR